MKTLRIGLLINILCNFNICFASNEQNHEMIFASQDYKSLPEIPVEIISESINTDLEIKTYSEQIRAATQEETRLSELARLAEETANVAAEQLKKKRAQQLVITCNNDNQNNKIKLIQYSRDLANPSISARQIARIGHNLSISDCNSSSYLFNPYEKENTPNPYYSPQQKLSRIVSANRLTKELVWEDKASLGAYIFCPCLIPCFIYNAIKRPTSEQVTAERINLKSTIDNVILAVDTYNQRQGVYDVAPAIPLAELSALKMQPIDRNSN